MFYQFSQNNSGGSFDFDKFNGITIYVIIEADSADEANSIAESIGIYFNGCNDGIDCGCCGDRWSSQWRDDNGDSEPCVYSTPVAQVDPHWASDKGNQSVCVHYKDGRKEWFA